MNIDSARHPASIAQPLTEPAAPRQPASAPSLASEQHGTPPSPRHARGTNSTVERTLRNQLGAQVASAAADQRASRSGTAPLQTNPIKEVFPMVNHVLAGIPYRAGGSLAARMQYGAPREPKDIDLEFRNYDDVTQAAQRLKEFRGAEATQFPHVEYFVETEAERNVSTTVMAMGMKQAGERPTSLAQIELNNENTRQGDRDFKHLPETRYGTEQPTLMRRNSLVAGVLERYSYTLAERAPDDKQDAAQLQHLLSGMTDDELGSLRTDIEGHFNWDDIRSAPPEVAEDSSSEEEGFSDASGSDSDNESSSVSSNGASAEPLVIHHRERMEGAMDYLGGLIAAEQAHRAAQ